jgi:hypothetical protein
MQTTWRCTRNRVVGRETLRKLQTIKLPLIGSSPGAPLTAIQEKEKYIIRVLERKESYVNILGLTAVTD